MAASEATPYAKTGGLADVIGALPFALKARGEDVAVVLPLLPKRRAYRPCTADRVYDKMPIVLGASTWEVRDPAHRRSRCSHLLRRLSASIRSSRALWRGRQRLPRQRHPFRESSREPSLGIVVVIPAGYDPLPRLANRIGRSVDSLRKFRMDPTFYGIKTLLTIHNLGYQGSVPQAQSLTPGPAARTDDRREHGVLRSAQFPERRNRFQRCDQHREQSLCSGDPDSRVRLRTRRSAARSR